MKFVQQTGNQVKIPLSQVFNPAKNILTRKINSLILKKKKQEYLQPISIRI